MGLRRVGQVTESQGSSVLGYVMRSRFNDFTTDSRDVLRCVESRSISFICMLLTWTGP